MKSFLEYVLPVGLVIVMALWLLFGYPALNGFDYLIITILSLILLGYQVYHITKVIKHPKLPSKGLWVMGLIVLFVPTLILLAATKNSAQKGRH